MPRIKLPIASGFYVSQSTPLADKRLVNMYPVIPQGGALSDAALFSTPGIASFASITATNSRGSIVFFDGLPYFVVGTSLVSLSINGVVTNHGVISGSIDVSMASNGVNIAIVNPTGASYFFTPSTGVLELSNSSPFLSFGQAETVTFKDGFYVYTTSSNFFSSSAKTVNDGKTFNALDFADAEISPDRIIKAHNNHNQLYIFGENTIEVFQTIATTGFPFTRIAGASIQKGCRAPNSVHEFDNGFVFIGGDLGERPAVWKGIGSQAQKISTSSVDQLLQDSTPAEVLEARCFTYSLKGNYFAVFTVGKHTLVYDAATGQWAERQTGITDGNGFLPWRAAHGVLAFGKILVGDDRSGNIGSLDHDVFTEYGGKIERIISTQPFLDNGDAIYSKELELAMRTGVGDATTPNPQIRHDYSDDGSHTYGSEISKSMGRVGEYNTRVRWSRLGRIPNSRVLRWKTTEPVLIEIYALYANAEGTNSG